jgi:hypothetical protein
MTVTKTRRIVGASAIVVLSLASFSSLAACSDEDGDGGTTDEEIQDGKDTVTSVKDQIDEEIDAQHEGTNEDGE